MLVVNSKAIKGLSLGGLALFFCLSFASPGLCANVLVNPSAESGSPYGWTTANNDLTTSTGWATDAYYSTGSHSLKIVNTTGKDSYWRGSDSTFSAPYPKTVTLGGYSKAQNVVLGSRGLYCLDFYIQFEDNTSTWYIAKLRFSGGTHGWEKKEATVTFPKGIKLIRPLCLLYYGATGTVWFDCLYAFVNPPQCLSMSPANPTVQQTVPTALQTTFSNPNGWQNTYYVLFMIDSSISAKNCFLGQYNQNTNKLYLRDDNNTTWLGGFTPGSSNTIENSYAKINCQNTTVTGLGNNLTVNWNITFKTPFLGAKNAYLYVYDDNLNTDGWRQAGQVTVQEPQEGELITTAGGEVASADGKIKVIIPSGALDTATFISVKSINTQSYNTPQGKSLLIGAECKPAGLIFKMPVTLIYNLSQAEVPGTPLELGLYSATQGKILGTGFISSVEANSYTVKYSVIHFSTYGALKSLLPQGGTPIGLAVKVPLPDLLTGSFSTAIPITVSPGRKGMQPALSLNYRSSNANSWVGLGFSLNPGYITRSTRLGPPTYNDTQDTFYFVTDAGTTELVHLTANLFQAKVESSFTKFYKEGSDSWRIVGKDGSKLYFGQSQEAKEGSARGTFGWYITRAEDTNGNYIDYFYIKDQGKTYLSRIDYTGNTIGVIPKNCVEFSLEAREDIPSSYLSSVKVATARRLKEIAVRVDSSLVWRYALEYAYSPDTHRSLLKSVRQYGADGKELPQQKMSYQEAR